METVNNKVKKIKIFRKGIGQYGQGSSNADEEAIYNEHTSENEITRKFSNKQRSLFRFPIRRIL